MNIEQWIKPSRDDTDRQVTHRMIAVSAVMIAVILVSRAPDLLVMLTQLVSIILAIPLVTHVHEFLERVVSQRRARRWKDESREQ